eukprot:5437926-Prymnesium_polylepis.1
MLYSPRLLYCLACFYYSPDLLCSPALLTSPARLLRLACSSRLLSASPRLSSHLTFLLVSPRRLPPHLAASCPAASPPRLVSPPRRLAEASSPSNSLAKTAFAAVSGSEPDRL